MFDNSFMTLTCMFGLTIGPSAHLSDAFVSLHRQVLIVVPSPTWFRSLWLELIASSLNATVKC